MATFEASTEDALLSDFAEQWERLKEVDSCPEGNPVRDADASPVDTQLQLPPAVEDLLQKLRSESKDSGLQSLHRITLQNHGWGSIFGGMWDSDVDGSLSLEEVKEVRLLVLAAIGQCHTLKFINLSDPVGEVWHSTSDFISLSLAELKALLEPLGSSHVLTELNISYHGVLLSAAGAEVVGRFLQVNRCCEVLHTCLGTMNPTKLEFVVSATEGLRSGNGHPALKYWMGFDKVGMLEARALLEACPKLQALCTNSERLTRWYCRNKSEAEEWGKMYLEHESLNSVGLEGEARDLDAFMGYATGWGTHPQKFFKRVQFCSTLEALTGTVLSSVLSATTGVVEVQCKNNPQFGPSRLCEDSLVPLHEIMGASTHNQFKKALTLRGFELHQHQYRAVALATLVRDNRVPERLDLRQCVVGNGMFGVFFRSLRENTTIRTLNLRDTLGLDDEAFREFLSALEVNSTIHDIDITGTDWVRGNTGVAAIRLRKALQQKKRRERYPRPGIGRRPTVKNRPFVFMRRALLWYATPSLFLNGHTLPSTK